MACIRSDKLKAKLKEPLVFILEDLDLTFTQDEINMAIFMWTAGWSVEDMAKRLRPRDGILNAVDEVTLLIMHLRRQNKIKLREGGIFGYGQAED